MEKAARERMLEVVVEVDGRPVSRLGCDGVVVRDAHRSTAYAFSAGGPIVWPEVEAMLMVPISAHALFARPIVVAPTSRAVDRAGAAARRGVLWCDGRRTVEVPPGARIEVRRGTTRSGWPGCTRRPSPTGWWRSSTCRCSAGGRRRAQSNGNERQEEDLRTMLSEIRITGLGVIEDATLDLDPGFTAVTGETGAGKTMVVTGVNMLLGGRADSGLVRHGARRARVEGRASGVPKSIVAAGRGPWR